MAPQRRERPPVRENEICVAACRSSLRAGWQMPAPRDFPRRLLTCNSSPPRASCKPREEHKKRSLGLLPASFLIVLCAATALFVSSQRSQDSSKVPIHSPLLVAGSPFCTNRRQFRLHSWQSIAGATEASFPSPKSRRLGPGSVPRVFRSPSNEHRNPKRKRGFVPFSRIFPNFQDHRHQVFSIVSPRSPWCRRAAHRVNFDRPRASSRFVEWGHAS